MKSGFRTVVIGFGRMGAGYADDPVMAEHYRYATHAQVLRDHPAFEWGAVVDPSPAAREQAASRWHVPRVYGDVESLVAGYDPEVAVIATPPESRLGIIRQMKGLRAVLVEKPLAKTISESERFLAECHALGIQVQVNLWRRADELFHRLAVEGLESRIGRIQSIFGVYGNGLLNNGTHMVDFVRMLAGEIESVRAFDGIEPRPEGPISGDANVPFTLTLRHQIPVSFHPVSFGSFRENALDVWGTTGRLSILQEGLSINLFPVCENRAMTGEGELASDKPTALASTVGHALYRMYDNLAEVLRGRGGLCSPGNSALETARAVEAVLVSVREKGRVVCPTTA